MGGFAVDARLLALIGDHTVCACFTALAARAAAFGAIKGAVKESDTASVKSTTSGEDDSTPKNGKRLDAQLRNLAKGSCTFRCLPVGQSLCLSVFAVLHWYVDGIL
jgi:hypothetical protein